MSSISIHYIRPLSEESRGNCVFILKPGGVIPPLPDPDAPPEGMEWVYDFYGDHILDINGNKIYTSIHL